MLPEELKILCSRNVTLSAARYDSSCTTASGAPCSGYSFDASVMRSTVVTDHGLVCGRLPLLPVVGSSYMAGIMIANLVAGYLADRLGRRTGAVRSRINTGSAKTLGNGTGLDEKVFSRF